MPGEKYELKNNKFQNCAQIYGLCFSTLGKKSFGSAVVSERKTQTEKITQNSMSSTLR